MELFGKDISRNLVVIAEIGVNHEGDVEAASRMLRLAAEAGADAVKLQTYSPDRFIAASDPERLKRVTRFCLSDDDTRRLALEAVDLGITLFSTAITEDVIRFLDEIFPVMKIASGDLTFEPAVRAAAATGKPVILSTGLGAVEEIDAAIGWVRDETGTDDLSERLVLMHCVSAYPTPIEEANLRSIPFLAERYGVPVGYSNHVPGLDACLAAVALGACVLEVHFTDRREGREFRDHHLSLVPDELTELVGRAVGIRAALGTFGKDRQPSEIPNLAAVRKGIVAARDLEAGTTLSTDDLMFARPATEFAAAEMDQVVGRRLLASVKTGESIRRKDVAK